MKFTIFSVETYVLQFCFATATANSKNTTKNFIFIKTRSFYLYTRVCFLRRNETTAAIYKISSLCVKKNVNCAFKSCLLHF